MKRIDHHLASTLATAAFISVAAVSSAAAGPGSFQIDPNQTTNYDRYDDVIDHLAIPVDIKSIPGATCQAWRGENEDDLDHGGNLYNAGSSTITVACPIVRDNTGNTDGTSLVNVYAYNPLDSEFACDLYSYTTHGVVEDSDAASTTDFSTVTLGLDVDLSAAHGYYLLFCDLPPTGRLYSYRYVEYDD